MREDLVFPNWIEDGFDEIRSNLSPASARSIDRFRSEYSRFQQVMRPLPDRVEMYEIYQISPEKLQKFFPDAFSALTHCCEYLVGYWLYRHTYKIKAYADGLAFSLELGNWLIACTCLRSMFEEIAHFDLYFSKIDRNIKKIEQLEKNEAKRIRQGKVPSEKWIKDYITCDLDIIQNIEKAVQGSDFDWSSWLNRTLKEFRSGTDETEAFKQSSSRKTHINDCIAHIEKRHKKPFRAYYDLLSEMVHPNFGSNTLVIVTREKMTEMFGRVWLAGAIREREAASWFFEIVSDPMAETLSIASRNISVSKHLYSVFQHRAEASAGRLNDLLGKPTVGRQRLN